MQKCTSIDRLRSFAHGLRMPKAQTRIYRSDWFLRTLLASCGDDLRASAKKLQLLSHKLRQIHDMRLHMRVWQSNSVCFLRHDGHDCPRDAITHTPSLTPPERVRQVFRRKNQVLLETPVDGSLFVYLRVPSKPKKPVEPRDAETDCFVAQHRLLNEVFPAVADRHCGAIHKLSFLVDLSGCSQTDFLEAVTAFAFGCSPGLTGSWLALCCPKSSAVAGTSGTSWGRWSSWATPWR